MTPAKKFSDEEFLLKYNQGLSDCEIARQLGVTRTSIRWRRIKFGLKPNVLPVGVKREKLGKEFKKLWNKGCSYAEIHQKLHIGHRTINKWKKHFNLPNRRNSFLRSVHLSEQCYLLRKKGLSDEEIMWKLQDEGMYMSLCQVRIAIGKAIMRRCRTTPQCPYKALLPEYEKPKQT